MTFALWQHAVHILAYGLGLGLSPFLPGAFGILLGLAVYRFIATMRAAYYAVVVLILAVAGIFICGQTARDFGLTDPGFIVYDEFVGILVAMYRLPAEPRWLVAGFVVFGVLDLWKPYPIHLAEELELGLGIMADDIAAGVCALAILHLLRLLLRRYKSDTRQR